MDSVRIDKWLWAVRLYKTRAVAAEACRKGHIRIDDVMVKASREIKPGMIITITEQGICKTVKVLTLLKTRVGAKLVDIYMEDLTPEDIYEQLNTIKRRGFEYRDKGTGRPTKRQRRIIDKLKGI
ncbi:MAG: RNA-binding S4 domain-containing protein [Bacteroidales bacterium]|nr:RNA-binding S4 domain-containing protein [Bacteroidales bacterium]